MKLTNEQWEFIAPVIPGTDFQIGRAGRPQTDQRKILDGILWIVKTGARWKDLPKQYPPYQTCHRRFQEWVKSNIFFKIIEKLVEHLRERGQIDLAETFIDATYVDAQKGGLVSEKPRKAMGPRSWQSQTVVLFLSPYMLRALHHMRVNLLRKRFGDCMLMTYLSDLSETKHTILMHLTPTFIMNTELSSSLPISAIANDALKMDDLLEDTNDDGLLNDSFLGSSLFDESKFDMRLS